MLIMGIDPGTATTGYGLVQGQGTRGRLVDYGTIRTPAGMSMPERLVSIHREMHSLLENYKPDVVAIEELFFHHNAKTAISVAQSRGVLVMTAARLGLSVAEYTPLQVKQAVVGYGNASKRQVQLMVQALLALKEIPRPDDAADALAIAICHLHSHRMNVIYESER